MASPKLYYFMRAYGVENFIFGLLKEMPGASLEQLQAKESEFFRKYNPSLNCLRAGTCSTIPSNAKPVSVFNIKTQITNHFASIEEAARFLGASPRGITHAIKNQIFFLGLYAI